MILLQITDIKGFMNRLLTQDTFDSFLLAEASVTTYNTFLIDGHLVNEFFQEEERSLLQGREFSLWGDMRALCFQLIKGKRTPVRFKFVLHAEPALMSKVATEGDLKALVLTIKYDASALTCTTATSFHTFSLDKAADKLWDENLREFFKTQEIVFEEP